MDELTEAKGVRQLRLVVHAEDYAGTLRFFRDVLGLPEQEAYAGAGGADGGEVQDATA